MLLLQAQIFLIIAVLLIAKPVGNALFLNRFGADSLPYAYILTAVVAAVISTIYAAAMRYFSILRVNLWSLGICLLLLLAFILLIPLREMAEFVAVGLYLWVALFGVLAASQFWTIASFVFDLRQAKRLFGPIGAGAIAGGIAGGYAASIFAGQVGIRPLLGLASVALVVVIGLTMYIWRRYVAGTARVNFGPEGQEGTTLTDAERSNTTPSTEDDTTPHAPRQVVSEPPHQIIARSRHLLLLCAIIALSVITAKLVDYQFSALASARYASPDRLASFFGFWFSTFNVIGLGIQLLATNRIVQRTGVSGALAVLPAGLVAGSIIMFLLPTLGAATFSRLVDGSLKQSLHRVGVEMLYLPIRKQVKNRIKTYIDVLIDSAAGGLGGLLLLLLVGYFGVSPAGISPLVFLLSVIWLACVFRERDEYLDAFREQLSHLRPARAKLPKRTNKRALSEFLQVLNEATIQGSTREILYVLDRTDDLSSPKFQEPIRRLLNHSAPRVRARAVNSLLFHTELSLFEEIRPLLEDPAVEVRNAALDYLVEHHVERSEEDVLRLLSSDQPEIAGAMLAELLSETRDKRGLRARWQLVERFENRVAALDGLDPTTAWAWRKQLLLAAGRSETEVGNRLISSELKVYGKDTEIVQTAIIAAGESQAERWVLTLIDFLSEKPYRAHASAALVQYGNRLLRLLPGYLAKEVIDIHDLRRLPRVLRGIKRQRTVSLLYLILEKYLRADVEVRGETIKALNALRRDDPRLKFSKTRTRRQIFKEADRYRLLLDLYENQSNLLARKRADPAGRREGLLTVLRRRREGSLDRLFRLLGLYYPTRDIIPIHRALVGNHDAQRINALEFLENLLDTGHKKLVIPLLEYRIRQPAAASYDRQLSTRALQRQELRLFEQAMTKGDLRLRVSVVEVMKADGDPRYDPLLMQAKGSRYARVRRAAATIETV